MYIRHKIASRDYWLSLTELCQRVSRISSKYQVPLKFEWDGDDVPITILVKPNSDYDDLYEQYLEKLKYSRLPNLIKALRKNKN